MNRPLGALLRTPLEIRRAVLSYVLPAQVHVCLDLNKIKISICLEPEKDEWSTCSVYPSTHKRYDGSERDPHLHAGWNELISLDETGWARRLQSTWGPHWECEESARDGVKLDCTILMVCKQLYSEGLDFLSGTLVFSFTDLTTLEIVTRVMTGMSPPPLNHLPRMLEKGITRLNITLRWPLAVFKLLESCPATPTMHWETAQQGSQVAAWTRIGETLSRLETLTNLRLWFDHSDLFTWALVNEKALLTALVAQISKTTIHSIIILPKLHPLHENEDIHFLEADISERIHVYRMLRQRWHGREDENGKVDVVNKPDFPFSIELNEDMSVEELEAKERQWLANGVDVELEAYLESPEYKFAGRRV